MQTVALNKMTFQLSIRTCQLGHGLVLISCLHQLAATFSKSVDSKSDASIVLCLIFYKEMRVFYIISIKEKP